MPSLQQLDIQDAVYFLDEATKSLRSAGDQATADDVATITAKLNERLVKEYAET